MQVTNAGADSDERRIRGAVLWSRAAEDWRAERGIILNTKLNATYVVA